MYLSGFNREWAICANICMYQLVTVLPWNDLNFSEQAWRPYLEYSAFHAVGIANSTLHVLKSFSVIFFIFNELIFLNPLKANVLAHFVTHIDKIESSLALSWTKTSLMHKEQRWFSISRFHSLSTLSRFPLSSASEPTYRPFSACLPCPPLPSLALPYNLSLQWCDSWPGLTTGTEVWRFSAPNTSCVRPSESWSY